MNACCPVPAVRPAPAPHYCWRHAQPAAFVRPDVPVPAAGRGRPRWRRRGRREPGCAAVEEILPAPELHALDRGGARRQRRPAHRDRAHRARPRPIRRRARGAVPSVDAASIHASACPASIHGRTASGRNAVVGLSMPAWEIDLWGPPAALQRGPRRRVLASAALADGVRTSLIAQLSSLYLDLPDLDAQTDHPPARWTVRKCCASRARASTSSVSILDDCARSEIAGWIRAGARRPGASRIAQTENALAILLGRNLGPIARQTPARLRTPAPGSKPAFNALAAPHPGYSAPRRTCAAGASGGGLQGLPCRASRSPPWWLRPAPTWACSAGYAWSLQPSLGLLLFDGGPPAGRRGWRAQQTHPGRQYKADDPSGPSARVADALVAFSASPEQRGHAPPPRGTANRGACG